MSEIILKDIHKYYGSNHVLKGLSFEVFEGNIVGLIGKNGAGKTTAFKVITGAENYEAGELMIARGKRVGILDQIPEYGDEIRVFQVVNSAFDELHEIKHRLTEMEAQMASDSDPLLVKRYGSLLSEYENRGGYSIDTLVKRVCMGLNIDSDMLQRNFNSLSGGEKTRINLARILLMDCHILLLDEPTNHLDIQSVEWLEDYLEDFEGTVVIISHDRYFLDKVTDRIVEIEDGRAESYEGNYSKYALLKEQRRIEQLARYEQEQKQIKKLEEAANRMHEWARRTNSAKLHKRAFGMEKRLERMVDRSVEKPKKERKLSSGFQTEGFSGREVLLLKNVKKSYEGRSILGGIDLLVKTKARMALLGNNGTGKTTLLKIILDEEKADSGLIRLGPSVRAAYLPQIVHFDNPEYTILDTIRHTLIMDEGRARNLLAGFKFTGEDVYKTVGTLSGGERSRLRLLILMQSEVNFLLLDEPTNHLDIPAREWIEEALDDFEGTILFVSHDRYFIRKFAQSVCELEDGQMFTFDGNYEEFRAWKAWVNQEKQRALQASQTERRENKDNRRKRPDPKQLEKKMLRLEESIAYTEKRLTEIEKEMEEFASDYNRLSALLEEKARETENHEKLMDQWMQLSEELAQFS